MTKSPTSPETGQHRSCLAAIVIVGLIMAAIGAAGFWALTKAAERSRKEFEQNQAERRVEYFGKVKAGGDGSRISIMDPLLLEMLAEDADCVANLTELSLAMVDIAGKPSLAAKSLVNVRKIVFYDCVGADELLRALQGSAAVEDIYFEQTYLSDDGVQLLATFPNLKEAHFEDVTDASREKLLKTALPDVNLKIPYPRSAERN